MSLYCSELKTNVYPVKSIAVLTHHLLQTTLLQKVKTYLRQRVSSQSSTWDPLNLIASQACHRDPVRGNEDMEGPREKRLSTNAWNFT
ncbi:hypothetical protein BaRGS_00009973, partial [Batillaria attramentaria]